VKKSYLLFSGFLVCLQSQSGYASEIQTKIQNIFANKHAVISDYDSQLKKVVVDDSNIYFATHDGRYLFAGPIIDTEKKTNIVSLQENQLRRTYLNSLPENLLVSYPSHGENKHTITVVTDIDCPYCRKFHNSIPSINKRGITVNYVMLPRAGVGSGSHKKTISALCSDSPADTITSAMQNISPTDKDCKTNSMSQHMQIAQHLKVNSTPTIILPNGQLKVGLVNPEQLFALLDGAK
jgi:thiol:disulfide interchange protein DsbC